MKILKRAEHSRTRAAAISSDQSPRQRCRRFCTTECLALSSCSPVSGDRWLPGNGSLGSHNQRCTCRTTPLSDRQPDRPVLPRTTGPVGSWLQLSWLLLLMLWSLLWLLLLPIRRRTQPSTSRHPLRLLKTRKEQRTSHKLFRKIHVTVMLAYMYLTVSISFYMYKRYMIFTCMYMSITVIFYF